MTVSYWHIAFLLIVAPVGPTAATDYPILGGRLLVRDPIDDETKRVALVVARETATDVPAIVGDPAADGATLRIITSGPDGADEFYVLSPGFGRPRPQASSSATREAPSRYCASSSGGRLRASPSFASC